MTGVVLARALRSIGPVLIGLAGPLHGVVACQEARLDFELDEGPFEAVPRPPRAEATAFTVLANDADLDGDPDLLVNWHVFAPPAILWNEAGRFRPDERGWSLPELAAAPVLDAERQAMLAVLRAHEGPGVFLWHSDRASFWFVAQKGPFPAGAESTLVLECNRPIQQVPGKRGERYEIRDETTLRLPLRAQGLEHAYFATKDIGLQVKARIEGPAVPLFLGPELVRHDGPVELWGRDPHGLAWLDVTGNPRPDLAVVRGALRGLLQPPLEGKFDDFYVAEGGSRPSHARRELPRGHGRGRAVQWVDLEGDGRLELYIGNKRSPNVLLAFDAAFARAEDRAPALGLDLPGADAFAWLDLDGDGDDDLVTLDAREGLGCLRNDAGRRFERLEAQELGLVLAPEHGTGSDEESEPSAEPGATVAPPGIDQHDLVVFDADDDGDLDLLVTGFGRAGACAFHRAEGAGFREASAEVGLAGLEGVTQVVVADFDADAWLDLLALGPAPRLFRNERGRFRPAPMAAEWDGRGAGAGTVCDADGDGRLDVVVAAHGLVLARNRAQPHGDWVTLSLAGADGAPVGALVRAHYADGSVQAIRAGSHHRGLLSQAFGPLPLAWPRENPLRRVEVRFPGGDTVVHEVAGPGAVRLTPPE